MRRLIVFALAIGVTSCLGVESPPGGIASISTIQLPWPAVVVGDTARDSTGVAAPIRVIAYDTRGKILSIRPSFFVLDRGIHLDSGTTGTFLVGDSVRSIQARLVATVGSLQTSPESVWVTVAPTGDSITTPVTSGYTDTLQFVPTAASDTLNVTNRSVGLALRILGDSTGVPGWIVTYRVTSAPQSTGLPSAFVIDAVGNPTTSDTTDVTGLSSRVVQLRFDRLKSTSAVDSIVVMVSTQYKGVPLPGLPFRFVVPIKFKGFNTS